MAQLYKKTGTCSRPDGAQTDYPMYLVVGESAGSVAYRHYKIAVSASGESSGYTEIIELCLYDASDTLFSPNNMTANDAPSPYVVAYSAAYNSATYGYKAFDGGTGYWLCNSSTVWLTLDLGEGNAESLASYSLKCGNSGELDRAPKNWIIYGSNDGSSWAVVHSVTGQVDWSAGETRTFHFCDVHCSGHCQTDFGDIRFHNAADAALDYMIDWPTLTGTTPNQSVGVWVAPSPGTSATDVVLKYGDAALTDASDGAAVFIKYKPFESGNDGTSLSTADGDWTVVQGACEIDTAQKYAGTRSALLHGVDGTYALATLPVTPSADIAISFKIRKPSAASGVVAIGHGDGSSRAWLYYGKEGDYDGVYYLNSSPAYSSLLTTLAGAAWHTFELKNFNWTADTYDLYVNDTLVAEGATEYADATAANVLFLRSQYYGSDGDCWIDNVIVRKYASPEPTWGTWGAEEEISVGSDCIIEAVTATLSPTASASPGISVTSTTGTLGPSASAGVALSVTALSAILGPTVDANLGISIAAASAILGPSASADFDINSEASVLIICQSATLAPSASAGVQISVASQTATLNPSAGIPKIYLILSAESAVLNPSASAAPAIGITSAPAILDPSAGIPGLAISLPAASAVLDPSASAGAMTVFQYSNPVILYYFTLTGAADGVADATIPISSFQARHRNGESTYLSVVIPDYDTYEDIIDARSNGQMIIRMAFSHAGAVYHSEEILRVDLDTNGIRKDQGGRSQSITLVGHRTETYSPQTLTLKNVTYRRTGNAGEISYRCAVPDIFLRPGDTAVYGSDSFTVGSITYSVSSGYTSMDVTEAVS